MYIKVYEKNNNKYYALYIYDKKNDIWASKLINYDLYNLLKDYISVK